MNRELPKAWITAPFWRYAIGAGMLWTVVIGGSLLWNFHLLNEQMLELAKKEALANFNKDQAFRLWGTKHGGVYAPVTEITPPSPYLAHIPERDIETPSGRKLTLLSPAYMARQLMDDYTELYGIRGKITGFVLLRPENAPDEWEKMALGRLRDGAEEVSEVTEIDGVAHHRMMRPLYMEPGCDKCHGHLGFKEGDFRGGVGISVPIQPYFESRNDTAAVLAVSHGAIWLLGLGGLSFGVRQVRRRVGERDKAEAESKTHRDRLAGILDIAPEAIVVIDREMKINVFNQGAERIFGYLHEEVLGQSYEILIPHKYRAGHGRHVDEFEQSNENFRYLSERAEISGLRKDGSVFPAAASISKLEFDGERIFTILLKDITRQKRDERSLIGAKEQAEYADRAKSEFLANMSHELRTPLNAIMGFADIMQRNLFGPIGDQRYQEYTVGIRESGEHLLSLINDILDLSKIEAGQALLEEQELQPAALVADCLRLVEVRAAEADLHLQVEGLDDLPALRADRRMVKQILLNLLSNAIKFSHRGGTVTVAGAIDGTRGLSLSVSDRGIGIAAPDIPKAMANFGQVESALDRKYEGTGLGLPLVKSLVELHGGGLDIESELGVGTSVSVWFPPHRLGESI